MFGVLIVLILTKNNNRKWQNAPFAQFAPAAQDAGVPEAFRGGGGRIVQKGHPGWRDESRERGIL